MSFPVIIHGAEGEIFQMHASKQFPLGTQIVLQDGRKFRYALKSSAAAVAGNLQQAPANTAHHVGAAVQAATAAGSRTIPITLGATAVSADEYMEGFIVIDTAPGNGYSHKIDTHTSVLSAGTFTVPLAPGHQVQVALTTSSVASVIRSPYSKVIICPTSRTSVPVGVAVKPITASYHGWLQTAGVAAVLTSGTVVLGDPVMAGGAAGAVTPLAGSGGASELQVGYVVRVAATTLYSTIFLTLDH